MSIPFPIVISNTSRDCIPSNLIKKPLFLSLTRGPGRGGGVIEYLDQEKEKNLFKVLQHIYVSK